MADGLQSVAAAKPDIFSSGQQQLLADNLDPKNVKSRKQPGGPNLSYIEGWHAINEANRIFGFGSWERELVKLERTNCDLVDVTKNNRTEKQWRVGYLATVRITVHGEGGSRHRDGTGFGSGYGKDNQLGEAVESAVKEAETDAMKRALATFGNQFGLALYDKAKANVGRSQLTQDDDDEDAGSPDAGQHEQPEAQREAGAGEQESSPAPVQTMSKGQARPDNGEIKKEIAACKTVDALKKWGAANAERVKRQPADWQRDIRATYKDRQAELEYMADSAADANRVFAEERR